MNGQSAKKRFSRLKIKLLQRMVFGWRKRLKVMGKFKKKHMGC